MSHRAPIHWKNSWPNAWIAGERESTFPLKLTIREAFKSLQKAPKP